MVSVSANGKGNNPNNTRFVSGVNGLSIPSIALVVVITVMTTLLSQTIFTSGALGTTTILSEETIRGATTTRDGSITTVTTITTTSSSSSGSGAVGEPSKTTTSDLTLPKTRGASTTAAAAAASAVQQPPPPLLEFPVHTKSVLITIGSNLQPYLPQKQQGPCAMTVAFEPIVHAQIPKHTQVMVVPAAVSNTSFLATMHVYNGNGVSSSLSEVKDKDVWWAKDSGEPMIVPVVSMANVLDSIPKEIEITHLATDMQGYDFLAVSSAMEKIAARKIPYLQTEVHMHIEGSQYEYKNTKNDFCEYWYPMMTKFGYKLIMVKGYQGSTLKPFTGAEVKERCAVNQQEREEADAYWFHKDIPLRGTEEDMKHFEFDEVQLGETFTKEEYAACRTK